MVHRRRAEALRRLRLAGHPQRRRPRRGGRGPGDPQGEAREGPSDADLLQDRDRERRAEEGEHRSCARRAARRRGGRRHAPGDRLAACGVRDPEPVTPAWDAREAESAPSGAGTAVCLLPEAISRRRGRVRAPGERELPAGFEEALPRSADSAQGRTIATARLRRTCSRRWCRCSSSGRLGRPRRAPT